MQSTNGRNVSVAEFYLWWLDEKGFEEEEEEPAKELTLKDRMKLLMKEQEERQNNVKRTDFSQDFSTVSISKAKESVQSDADSRRKIHSKTWDIKADLAERTSTAGAIMSLFSNVRPLMSSQIFHLRCSSASAAQCAWCRLCV